MTYEFKPASRMRQLKPSATLAMNTRAKDMRAQGVDVLSFSAGEPDFDTPIHIKDAAKVAMNEGQTKYTQVPGTLPLRKAIVEHTRKVYHFEPELAHVNVGCGGKHVLFNAISSLINPGDEVIIPAPYWVSYPDMVRFAGGTPVFIEASQSQRFLPTAEQIGAAMSPKTKLIILNSPSNPTGMAFSKEELVDIAAVLRNHPQCALISDDIYQHLTFDRDFVGIAQIAEELRERTLIVGGVSKTYAMTGWRIGFGIGPKAWISAINKLQGASTSGACSIAQAAATAALSESQDAVSRMRGIFLGRRDRIVEMLNEIPGISCQSPDGAFYVFPNVSAVFNERIPNSLALCEHLLDSAHIALVPGSAFGMEGHLRMSFACSDEQTHEGIQRLRTSLEGIA